MEVEMEHNDIGDLLLWNICENGIDANSTFFTIENL